MEDWAKFRYVRTQKTPTSIGKGKKKYPEELED